MGVKPADSSAKLPSLLLVVWGIPRVVLRVEGGLRRVCSRGAQRVLRYGDMEYVMLHLIFIYLMPGEGQPAAYAASDL